MRRKGFGVPDQKSLRIGMVVATALLMSPLIYAQPSVIDEPDGRAYHYVTHHSVDIRSPAQAVWRHVLNVQAWMYQFELAHVSGEPGAVGEVRRLYAGQDFLVQIIHVIPNRLLVIANLPSTFQGEYSTGVAVVLLTTAGQSTRVDLTMSRRYTPLGQDAGVLKARRTSDDFQIGDQAMWTGFLTRLRELAEGGG